LLLLLLFFDRRIFDAPRFVFRRFSLTWRGDAKSIMRTPRFIAVLLAEAALAPFSGWTATSGASFESLPTCHRPQIAFFCRL
jgi:hypothetical protein